MLRMFLVCLSLHFFCFSCTVKERKKKRPIYIQPMLIHPLFFQDECALNFNYPFWFNDSIVAKHRIKDLTISEYSGSIQDTTVETDDVYVKRTLIYTFNVYGELVKIQFTDFFEGIIFQQTECQLSKKDASGFAVVEKEASPIQIPHAHQIFKRLTHAKQYDKLVSIQDGETIYFIKDKALFGPISVDSMIHPRPKDWIVLGASNRPNKRYKVKNTVKEKQVTTYNYLTSNYPSRIDHDDFPFFKKRYFNYPNGVFTGYTDSLFIDNTFVTYIKTSITYNKYKLPVKITHQKAHNEAETNFHSYEEVSYGFYK